jgi:hypothetical protein
LENRLAAEPEGGLLHLISTWSPGEKVYCVLGSALISAALARGQSIRLEAVTALNPPRNFRSNTLRGQYQLPGGVIVKVSFRVFRSQGFSDTQLEPTASAASEFATSLEPERLISISHTLDAHIHIVTVWYWETAGS